MTFTRTTASPLEMAALLKAVATLGGELVRMEAEGSWANGKGIPVYPIRDVTLRGGGFYATRGNGTKVKIIPFISEYRGAFDIPPSIRATFVLR